MARPTKFRRRVADLIVAAVAAGNTRTAAAASAGIGRATLSRWVARYEAFRDALIRAEAEAEVSAVAALRAAWAAGDWRAAQAWLERRRHEDWGKVDRLELQIRREAERVAEATGADPDWLVKRAAEIAAATGRATEGVE